ncbi:hypothetical protein LF130101_815 [Limosilactobacillus fermentum]|nr:hypothetical protein LF130101_815 [Limosilactobacillus fermentum]
MLRHYLTLQFTSLIILNQSLYLTCTLFILGLQLLKEIRDLKAKLREREVQIAFSKKLIEISNREVKRPNDIKRFKK